MENVELDWSGVQKTAKTTRRTKTTTKTHQMKTGVV